jgi:hypothetical protein
MLDAAVHEFFLVVEAACVAAEQDFDRVPGAFGDFAR